LILAKRKAVYAAAKRQNPARWSGEIRNWEPAGEVWLNPEKPEVEEVEIRDEVA
jgi:putative transposase